MIKRQLLLAVAILAGIGVKAQSFENADKVASKIPSSATKSVETLANYISDKLSTPEEQLRAAYVWISKNIGYEKGGVADFISDYDADSAANVVIKKRKAVCSGYAELFSKTCRKLGFEAFTVTGYTMLNGEVDDAGHAWNAVKTAEGKWYLFDPMWGAGMLSKGKFNKKATTTYCLVEPALFLKTHMPFDPVWQLVSHPIKAEAFLKSEDPATKGVICSYNDTIKREDPLLRSEQLTALCRRLKWAGDVNKCTSAMIENVNQQLPLLKKREKNALEYRNVTQFNGVADKVNKAIEFHTKFTSLKKNFRSKGVTAFQMKAMMDSCSANIAAARQLLVNLNFEKEDQQKQKLGLEKTVNDLQKQVEVQNAFLKKQKEFATKKKKGKK